MSQKTVSNLMLNFITKWLIFTLMVSGLAKSILVSLIFPIPFWTVTLMVTAFYIALWLYFSNRLTSIAMTLTAAMGMGIYLRYFAPKSWWNDTFNFFKWLFDYTLGLVDIEPQYIYPATWLVVFILSVVLYVFVIKLEWFVIPFAVCTGIIAIEWVLGHTQIIPWLWPLALSWIMVLGTKQYRRLSRQYSMPDFGVWHISTLPLAIAVVLTSSVILPNDTQDLKWDFLERTVQDISDRWSEWAVFSSPRQPFRLSQTGFPSSSDQLGGPVKISDDVVLTVNATDSLYLRGTILNEYTGSGWKDSIDDKRYKLNSMNWENAYREAFDWDEPIWEDLRRELKDRFFTTVRASVTHTGIETSVIFNAQRLEGITVQKRWGGFTPYFNGKGETFTSRDISTSESYILHVAVPNIEDQTFLGFLYDYIPIIDWHQPIPQILPWDGANREKLLHIQQHYTAVPESIPSRVAELAHSITRNIKTPLGKALALQTYLQQNYDYTLQPPYTPPNVDFVDYFLFELKSGYCTYFATAMAVMGRIVGLPTRYIEGFRMPPQPDEENLYEVKKLNGHAWVEIYFPKVGWLTFDPTPIEQHEGSTGQQQGQYPDQYWDEFPYPWMQDEEMAGYQPDIDIETGGPSASPLFDNLPPSIIISTALLVLALLGMTGLKVWDILRWKKIKKLPFEKQLSYCYHQILWLLTLYGFPMRRGETPYAYARRVDTWLTNSAGSMTDICHLIVKNQFGAYPLTEQEMKKIREFYRNLEEHVKSLLGFYPYIFKLISKQLFFKNLKTSKQGKIH